MLRLIALFIAAAMMFNNGTTVALAMCQHVDAQAHADARNSADEQVSSAAVAEESAERSVTHSKAFSDGSPGSAVAFVIPNDALALWASLSKPMAALLLDERVPPGGSIAPLLRPPLG